MKNIHILQTDKPSRLACDFDKLILNSRLLSPILYKNQNIYITNDEEIKDGEYGLSKLNEIIKFHSGYDYKYYTKIILATDQDLIKDGVQAIDDEFLEWFVKNPSCEVVGIEGHIYKGQDETEYKIIIPKEEETKCYCGHTTTCDCGPEDSKQNIIDMMKGDKALGLYDEIQPEQIWNEEKKKGIKQLIQEPKQETLEEVAEKKYGTSIYDFDQVDAFIEGAKWQAERMYSEEEVIDILLLSYSSISDKSLAGADLRKWFEQFKKK